MKLAFELRKEKMNKSGLIPIQLVVRYEGKRIRKNTGVSVLENHWNGSRIIANVKREEPNDIVFSDGCMGISEK